MLTNIVYLKEPIMIAKVRWFNTTFGYGFLRDEEGRDIFIHWSSFQSTNERDKLPSMYRKLTPKLKLVKHERIQFNLKTVKGRPQAVNCSRYSDVTL